MKSLIHKPYILVLFISFFLLGGAEISHADSLYNGLQLPLYSVQGKRLRVGDVITVYVSESTSAVQEATTRTQKDSSLGTNLVSNWDQVANLLGNETIRKTFDFELRGNDAYEGQGQTSRRSKLQAIITAVVTEVLESGNLFIIGEHKIKVNNEVETIQLSGIIRPQDISGDNTVLSHQIAKAEISVLGAGVVGSKQTPGVLTKMFNWMF